jgi:S1-C subfamily serine protease
VRRAAALILALGALVAAGCNSGDDDSGGSASSPREVTTTKVKVVQGIGGQGSGFDPAEIYKRLSPGVVTVLSVFQGAGNLLDSDGEGGQGSGFVLDGKGYVATNAHVVTSDSGKRAEQVFVEFSDGNRVSADVVGVDLNADVGLLKVDPAGLSLTPLTLGQSHNIDVGEPVAAIGSPFGERQSLSIGVISAIDRNIDSLTRFKIGDAIQTDAAINPGNSGGPLLDAHGRVLGINAQIKSQSGGGEGVGFAIPVDAVRRSLDALREHGRVDYGYLGVSALAVWPQLAERLGLDVRNGALIQDIESDSPAEKAGLRAGDHEIKFQAQDVTVGGDVIVAVGGKPLTRTNDLADRISSLSTGDEVELDVVRDGKHRTVQVELGQRPRGSG